MLTNLVNTRTKAYIKDYIIHDLPKKTLQIGLGIIVGSAFNSIDRWMHPIQYAIKGAKPLINPLVAGTSVAVFALIDYVAKKNLKTASSSTYSSLLRLTASSAIAGYAIEKTFHVPAGLAMSIIGVSIIAKTYLLSISRKHDQVSYPEIKPNKLETSLDPEATKEFLNDLLRNLDSTTLASLQSKKNSDTPGQ